MTKLNKLLFVTFLCFLCFTLKANSQVNYNLDIEEFNTNKEFKFLFIRNCDLPKVSLNISFKDAGYAYENKRQHGIAWLTSLIIQEGSGKNSAKDFAKKLEDRGISLNFFVDAEVFRVSLDAMSENLEDAMSLLSDAIMRPKADNEGFSRVLEKAKVIFSNLERDPYFIAKKELDKLLFRSHPYARNKYGTLDTIMNITRDDIMTYIKRNIARDNIVISIVGCTTKEEISTLLDKYLHRLPSQRSKVKKIYVKNDFGIGENKNVFMDTQQSVIAFAQKGISYNDPYWYVANILINAIGSMKLNSVLMKELRKNLGITYSISADILSKKHGSAVFGFVSTDNFTSDEAISAIKEVLSKVKKNGIEEQLFRDTKKSIVNNFIFFLSNNINAAIFLDEIQIDNRGTLCLDDYIKIINNIRLEEVNEFAASFLDPENLFFVKVGKNI